MSLTFSIRYQSAERPCAANVAYPLAMSTGVTSPVPSATPLFASSPGASRGMPARTAASTTFTGPPGIWPVRSAYAVFDDTSVAVSSEMYPYCVPNSLLSVVPSG